MQNTKLKLFVDAHCFDTGYQGTQTFIKGLYNGLKSNFPDLDIYFGAYHTNRIKQAFPNLDASRILKYRSSKTFWRIFIGIPHLIKKHNFDFAHFQNIAPQKIATCRYIVTLHDILYEDYSKYFPSLYKKLRSFIFKRSISNAFIKTTVSSYSQKRISFHYSIPPDELNIISNAVTNPIYFNNKEEAQHYFKSKYGFENFILCVSRIEPRKNHQLIIQVYKELELYKKGIHLVFIGEKTLRSTILEKSIKSLHPSALQYFHWFPKVDQKDLEAFYSSCKFCVYPSIAEGFGIPPLEAALHYTPVLCSASTAMSDYYFFQPYTFNPVNYSEFKQKFQTILSHPPTDLHLNSIAGKIIAKYSWTESANKFYKLISSAV